MGFHERLRQFGFSSYSEYLDSDAWKAFRDRYRAGGKSMRCAVCNGTPVQLHHHDYSRVCQELLADVTPLCREHHEEVHAILKAEGWPVMKTGRVVRRIRAALPAQPVENKEALPSTKKSNRQRKRDRKNKQAPNKALNEFLKKDVAAKKLRERQAAKENRHKEKSVKQPQVTEKNWHDPVFLMKMAALGIRRPTGFR